jgi:hypothetical protein
MEVTGISLFGPPVRRHKRRLDFKHPVRGSIWVNIDESGSFRSIADGFTGVGEAALIAYAARFKSNSKSNGAANDEAMSEPEPLVAAHDDDDHINGEEAPDHPDDPDPDAPPKRAPEIQKVLDGWATAMRLAKDDRRRLMAIATFSKMLGRLNGDTIEARDYMMDRALYMYDMDADEVQAALHGEHGESDEAPQPPSQAEKDALAEMNAVHATVSVAGKFRVMTYVPDRLYPSQRVAIFSTKTDFLNQVVVPKIANKVTSELGERTIRKPRGKWWIDHPRHRQFDDIDFIPGKPGIIEVRDTAVPGRILRKANMFCGFSCEPAQGDCQLFLSHVFDHVCQRDKELYKYILNWMASGVQNPGNPARTALSMRGKPGAGKGIFATGYGKIFGRHFLHLTNREHVVGKFNAHSAESCLTFADEALFVGDARDADIIKTLISEETKMVERKGIDAIPVGNYARTIFATNHDHALRIEADDRRIVSIHVVVPDDMVGPAGADKRRAYFMPIIEQMDNGGRAALLHELLDRDIQGFNPEAIPQTEELGRQKLLSAPPGDRAVIELAQEGILPGALPGRPWMALSHVPDSNRAGLLDHIKRCGGRALEHASDNAISDILKRWGFEKKHTRTGNAWAAPGLTELRAKIAQMYPAVAWTDQASQWGEPADRDDN